MNLIDFLNNFFQRNNISGYLDKSNPILFAGHKRVNKGQATAYYNAVGQECLSNFYYAPFTINVSGYGEMRFVTNEQFMMAMKAKVFNSNRKFKEIMNCGNPYQCKILGRKVQNFDPDIWEKYDRQIVFAANLFKFLQNNDPKKYLLSTSNKFIAEAAPWDSKWGIGINTQTARTMHVNDYPGKNYLGWSIMSVREALRYELHKDLYELCIALVADIMNMHKDVEDVVVIGL